MLYLVATPIGNLSDFSFRAIDVLKSADLILCEDTRHSLKLLKHYAISKPLASYHKFNEKEKVEELLEKLKEGKTICLISDAGTPLISDPGSPLVKACIEANIPVTSIPGACALIQALVASGLTWERFQFIGFLPKKEKELNRLLLELISYPGVSICYESPNRIEETIEMLNSIKPSLSICLARELTKVHETYLRGSAHDILTQIKKEAPRGECVLLIKGETPETDFSTLSLEDHVKEVQSLYQISKREAIKIVAELRHLNKRELYRTMHKSD